MTVKRQMKINFGGNRMRPNRYPYTKNQWEEETTLVCFGDGESLEIKNKINRLTGEQK